VLPPSSGQVAVISRRQSHDTTDGRSVSQSVSQSVSASWLRDPSGTHDHMFALITVVDLSVVGAPSLTRGRVCLVRGHRWCIILIYYGNLDISTGVCLTATRFEPFTFSMLGFPFACVSNIYIIVILYGFWLLPACFCYIIVTYGILNARCKARVCVRLCKLPVVQRSLFCRPCNVKTWVSAANSQAWHAEVIMGRSLHPEDGGIIDPWNVVFVPPNPENLDMNRRARESPKTRVYVRLMLRFYGVNTTVPIDLSAGIGIKR
jgi:hypothetical protein